MTDPSSTPSSGSGSGNGNAWPANPTTDTPPASSLDTMRAGTSSSTTTNGSFAGSAGGAPASSAADTTSTGPNPTPGGPGTTAAAGAGAGAPLPDLPDRLSRNAATLTYLRQCHAEVLSSLRSAQAATAPLQTQLAHRNVRAQTAHGRLATARRKLSDALYVNAHLREENDMIRTDDDRWAFQVQQREEQLESLTELLAKLEAQQAAIDERKRAEEAAMVRRLEAERAEVVRMGMVAERERMLAQEGGDGGAGGAGGAGAVGAVGAGGGGGMPILPRGTGEMSRMLALAPEWTPVSSSAGGGGGGGMVVGGAGTGYPPAAAAAARGGGGGGQQPQQPQQRATTSLSEAIAIEPPHGTSMGMGTSSGAGADDAASAVSALTADM